MQYVSIQNDTATLAVSGFFQFFPLQGRQS